MAELGIELMAVRMAKDVKCPHVEEPTAVADFGSILERAHYNATGVELNPYWDRQGRVIGAIGKCSTCGKVYYYIG